MDTEEIGDVLALTVAAGKVALDARKRIAAAKRAESDGGSKVTLVEAERIVKAELATLEAPVMRLVRDLID